ncbi:MAG: hypothetical protein FWG17_05280 [Desulfovibrionaceae bacterium]|nr:hypothetical protein [Desulfovibrionaceae bacterium]
MNLGSFLYNRKNAAAVRAAENFSRGSLDEPLIFHGPPACGKTCLLLSIHSALENISPSSSYYFNMLEGYFPCTKNQEKLDKPDFLRYVLLDNVEADKLAEIAACGKESKGLILAMRSGRQPDEISVAFADKKPEIHALVMPDLDIRLRWLLRKAHELGITHDNRHILKLALNYQDLESASKHLNKKAAAFMVNVRARPLTPEEIIQKVANFFGIDPEQILGNSRVKKINLARQLAMFLCRDLLKANLKFIGDCFHGKNHTSVLYSLNKISILCKKNQDIHNLVTRLKQNITQQASTRTATRKNS